jgi:hypothetical protein
MDDQPWTLEDSIADIEHVSYHWPDGVHTREELERLEPGRRPFNDDGCPCRNCKRSREIPLSIDTSPAAPGPEWEWPDDV